VVSASAASPCTEGLHIPFVPGPVLQVFGNQSGTSHLLQAPIANPNEIAIRTVQIFRMQAPPPESQYDRFF
jgi:hypothetical protein